MKTVELTSCQPPSRQGKEPSVMALGFFDGVHIGHQRVIQTAKQIATEKRLKLSVMSFFPHPKEVLEGKTVSYLTPANVKESIFGSMGVDTLYLVKFDLALAKMSQAEFIRNYVVAAGAEHVVAGFDFTYGYRGSGNMQTIAQDGKGCFEVTEIPKAELFGQKISSTLIRESLLQGNVQLVTACLGKYYETAGRISEVRTVGQRGQVIVQVVTMPYFTLPASGLYEVLAEIGGAVSHGIARRKEGSDVIELKLKPVRDIVCHSPVSLKWVKPVSEFIFRRTLRMKKLEKDRPGGYSGDGFASDYNADADFPGDRVR